jgi:acetoacetate decarboxylase
MLYALNKDELHKIRKAGFRPSFTNAEMLIASYRTDPAVIAELLPRPLKPAPEPLALVFVARYPETNFGCVYNEGALFVQASFHGKLGGYCLAMPVDDDMAMIGGRENYGFPKKMAETISLGEAGPKVVGRVVRKGVEILSIELDRSEPADAADLALMGAPEISRDGRPYIAVTSYLTKFSLRSDGKGFDHLPRLIRQTTDFQPQLGLMKGPVRIKVASSPTDPLGEVPVLEPMVGVYGYFDNMMLPAHTVARFWNPLRFARHAFFKTDLAPILLGEAGAEMPARPRPIDAAHPARS